VNGLLVEEGYARVFDVYNKTTKRYNELKVLEEKAKSENKGIWSC
jgi:endonuclease YncB( thermonuclease family)